VRSRKRPRIERGPVGRSPETATPDDVKYFQQYLIESGVSICTRNRTVTGVKFLFRVTLRRHDLVAEIFHLKKPVKVPLVLSKDVADLDSSSLNQKSSSLGILQILTLS
jgi:site-specific recombinase XerD